MSEPKLATLTKINRLGDEEDYGHRPLELRLYKRMFRYTSDNRPTLLWLIVCVVVRSIQLPLLPLLLAMALNGPIHDGDVGGLFKMVGAYVALSLFIQFVLYHRLRLSMLLGEGLVHNLRNDLFAHLQTMSMGFFTKTRLGRIISRFTTDIEVIRAGVQDAVFGGMVNAGNTITAAAILLYRSPKLFLIVLLAAPVYFGVYQYFRGKLSTAFRVNQESYSRVTATLAESVNGIRVTQGFARQDVNAELFNNLVEFHAGNNMATFMASGTFVALIDMLRDMVIAVLLGTGAFLVVGLGSGKAVADLIVYYYLIGVMLAPLAVLGTQYSTAVQSMAGAERVFKMLDRQPELVDPPDAIDLPPIQGRVEFRDLSFAYNPGTLVLHEVNFVVEPGQTIALVGHTGSGKSSIINLISKFYVPTTGRILIDGYDITRIKTQSLHAQMGIVLQSNFLFTGTVMDNIRVGKLRGHRPGGGGIRPSTGVPGPLRGPARRVQLRRG